MIRCGAQMSDAGECIMIDWNRLNELREEIGEDDFAEVVEIFLEEVEGSLDTLKEAPAGTSLRDLMHFLKGSSLNLGFSALADLCRIGESAAEAGGSDRIDRDAIIACYGASRELFQASANTAVA